VIYNYIIMESLPLLNTTPKPPARKIENILSTTRGVLTLAGSAPNAQQALRIAQGVLKYPTIANNSLTILNKNAYECISVTALVSVLATALYTTAFANACIDLFNKLTEKVPAFNQLVVPYSNVLISALGVYSSTNAIAENYQAWMNAENPEEANQASLALVQNGAALTYYALQLAGTTSAPHLVAAVKVGALSAKHFVSVVQILKTEYDILTFEPEKWSH
jgi:hypothetical protein